MKITGGNRSGKFGIDFPPELIEYHKCVARCVIEDEAPPPPPPPPTGEVNTVVYLLLSS